MKKLPITVIILTYNEELNLPQCLKNIKPHVDEIIIIDSYSTDRTKEIAKKHNATIVDHEFKNQAQQFNWALDNLEINNKWILRLDADEWVTDKLWNELEEKLEKTPENITGYMMKRRVYFMNKWIKHGGYYPTWFLRLFKKGKARYEEREVDEHLFLTEGKLEKLENDFVDENHKDLAWWTQKINNYTTRETRERLKTKKDSQKDTALGEQAKKKRIVKENFYIKLPLFCRAFAYFIYRYIFRLGFLDGKEGLIFHFLQGCWNQFLVDAKLYENKINEQKE